MRITKILNITILTLMIAGCSPFSNYWILEEERLNEIPEVRSYTERIQQDEYSNSASFSVFTISEGRKMVVISSGDKTKALEFSQKKSTKKDQEIIVKEIDNETNHNNPFLLVGLDKIEGDLQVYNESTKEYITNADENQVDSERTILELEKKLAELEVKIERLELNIEHIGITHVFFYLDATFLNKNL